MLREYVARRDRVRYCIICGAEIGGLRRKYCSDECKAEGARAIQREYYKRTARVSTNGKWGGCTEKGCSFFATCRANIRLPWWSPYCFTESKYHGLFLREYGKVDEMELIEVTA